MKTLYFDCGMGAAGDMLTAALLELFPENEREGTVKELNSIGVPDVTYIAEKTEKCGIMGTHMRVLVGGEEESEHMHDHGEGHLGEEHHHHEDHHSEEHHHEEEHHHDHEETEHTHVDADGHVYHHSHTGMHGIEHIVKDHLNVSDKIKSDIMAVYRIIAEAESNVHGVPITDIHFHEVGTMDAVADVAAVCILIDKLSPERIVASPVHVGAGTVKCAHGILPVPAPATALILKGIPIYGGTVQSELCTPTGAALLKYFVTSFGDMPVMQPQAIGYGMGRKDFERANCLRAVLGESESEKNTVIELSCNIDDMTAEEVGFAMNTLLDAGALEVYTIPIGMKKCRPGILLSVMCKETDKDRMISLIFKHTSTIGVRENISKRYTLKRSIETVDTEFGKIRRKVSEGFGVRKSKYEHEDLAKISAETGLSIKEILEKI